MKIKMLTLAAGPGGVRQPGQIYEVAEKEAKSLIEGGYAVDAAHLPEPVRRAAPARAVARRGKTATETEAGDGPDEE